MLTLLVLESVSYYPLLLTVERNIKIRSKNSSESIEDMMQRDGHASSHHKGIFLERSKKGCQHECGKLS